MDDRGCLLVFGELEKDDLSSMTAQLMRAGGQLAKNMGRELCLLFIGSASSEAAMKGYGYGADRVMTADDPHLETYLADSFLQPLEQIVRELGPAIVLFGHNDRGFDLAPRLAFRLKAGAILDCVELEPSNDSGLVNFVKPVFGGKALGRFSCSGPPRIASIREGAFEPADFDKSKRGEVLPLSLALDESRIRTRFVGKTTDENLSAALSLTSAKIVVSGGRGLKDKEGVSIIRETADLLGGAIGGSRPVVDNGWLPSSLQVGLTGKKVSPHVYIAVGISGSLQHMAGCLKSKTIVAINCDQSAPIFRLSRIGAVGDYRQILEGFNAEIRNIKEGGMITQNG
jgi:electron transfer flavoprotein alpha subunit